MKRVKIIGLVCSILLGVVVLFWSFNSVSDGALSSNPNQKNSQLQNVYENALQEFDLTSKMKNHNVPGISFAVIKDGKLDWAKGYGILQKGKPELINTETMFSVGSISKVGAAIMALKLQSEGKLDIDSPINQYLKSWKIPENRYTKEQPVTLRRIMSHTAGLTVHGFADFQPDEKLPTTVQILKGERPAKNGAVYVNIPVGSRFRYSGGGTTITQLVVEDITNKSFYKAAQDFLFKPLKMKRSSYQNPLPISFGNIAKAHNRNGNPVALPRGYQSMPETAASGLWTTPTDFSKVMLMLIDSYYGEDSTYLSQSITKDMMKPVVPSTYGLGPRIKHEDNKIQFSHGGANDSYRANFIGYMHNKNGVIVFTNGTNGSDLIDELLPVFETLLK